MSMLVRRDEALAVGTPASSPTTKRGGGWDSARIAASIILHSNHREQRCWQR